MYVLTWNLFHGRAKPAAGRPLLYEFATALAGWEWDVALLQEVPPWWPATLAHASGAEFRASLTSRNAFLPLRRAIATRNPDLIASNGGGCNAILVRGRIEDHREMELCRTPERRTVHGVLTGWGWVWNTHLTKEPKAQTRAELARVLRLDGVLGGDFNLRDIGVPAAGHWVDHIVGGEQPELLDAGTLSDHLPLRASVAARSRAA